MFTRVRREKRNTTFLNFCFPSVSCFKKGNLGSKFCVNTRPHPIRKGFPVWDFLQAADQFASSQLGVFEQDQNSIFCSPWHLQCLCLCGLGCGRFPVGSRKSQQGWEHLQEGGQGWWAAACSKSAHPNRERLLWVTSQPQEALPPHRTPPYQPTWMVLKYTTSTLRLPLFPERCVGMCFFDILFSNTQSHILVSAVNKVMITF